MKQSYDKALTRACRDRDVHYLFMGRRYLLERGERYRVKFDRKKPAKSTIVKVGTF